MIQTRGHRGTSIGGANTLIPRERFFDIGNRPFRDYQCLRYVTPMAVPLFSTDVALEQDLNARHRPVVVANISFHVQNFRYGIR